MLAAVAIALPLIVYLAQDSMIFYRQPLPEARRTEVARRYPAVQELFLQAKDGVKLHAWHVKAAGSAPLVVYFGGNAEEVSWMIEEAGSNPEISWLLTSYRGYGLSEGAPGEAALVADGLQWFDHALTLPGVDPKRIFVFGRSLGSGVAVALAAQRPLAGVILATPYDSLAAVAKRYYWYLPVDLLLKHRFDSIALAPAMKQPLLCLIAARDEVIPPSHGERLCEAWGGPRKKVLLQEAGHNTTDSHPLFWTSIREFLAQKVQ
jgi:pimeloyl-ACP methyl ester carboxylesterase